MDAFSVSLANGLGEPKMSRKKHILTAGSFAFFQFLMPMAGYILVRTAAERFRLFGKAVPYIALILLLFIGGEMLIEGIKGGETQAVRLTPKKLFVQSIATSIDALSVGFTISGYNAAAALVASLIIGTVTFFICFIGLSIGRKAGSRLSGKAVILGGCILIFIGLEIFIKSFI
ncbi:MAG: manganese efflux pump [Ruminococcus sp.]|nr:manganese efflux pump [Ruminococcus sp.]